MPDWQELTFPFAAGGDASNLVLDDDQSAIATDPLRWRILQALGAGRSVAELAELLGVTDTRMHYHLMRLVEAGAAVQVTENCDPRQQHFAPTAARLRVRGSRPENACAGDCPLIPWSVVEDFNQAALERAEGVFGAACQVSINHNRARLSEAQAAEFSRRLLALIEEYFPPGKGDSSGIKYGFFGVLTPIDLHPFRDREGERQS